MPRFARLSSAARFSRSSLATRLLVLSRFRLLSSLSLASARRAVTSSKGFIFFPFRRNRPPKAARGTWGESSRALLSRADCDGARWTGRSARYLFLRIFSRAPPDVLEGALVRGEEIRRPPGRRPVDGATRVLGAPEFLFELVACLPRKVDSPAGSTMRGLAGVPVRHIEHAPPALDGGQDLGVQALDHRHLGVVLPVQRRVLLARSPLAHVRGLGIEVVGERRGSVPRVAEVRAAEVRAAEVRVAEVRAAEVHAAEVRAAEVRAAEVRAAKVRAEEVRAAEVRVAEVRAAEVRAEEVRAAEVRAAEVGAAKVRAEEVRAAEVRVAEVRAGGYASRRYASPRFAPPRSAPPRSAPPRSASPRYAPRRYAPPRSAPRRYAPALIAAKTAAFRDRKS